jgi:hypothetical protein
MPKNYAGKPRFDKRGVTLTANTGGSGDYYPISTTPLAANATFVGGAIAVDPSWPSLAFAVVTEAAGTTYVDYSMDAGVTWKPMGKLALAALSYVTALGALLIAPHVRVRYVNGAVAQTDFYLAAKY